MKKNINNLRYWSNVPDAYFEKYGEDGDFSRKYLLNDVLIRSCGDVRNKHILDVGAGEGYLSRKLARMGGIVTGVEPSRKMFEKAIFWEKRNALGVKYKNENILNFCKSDAEFDIVVSNMVIMLISDYKKAIKNCVKVLKPQGKLLISILHPCFDSTGEEWNVNRRLITTNYFDKKHIKRKIGYSYHRIMSDYINTIISHGCMIIKLHEPRLSREIAVQHPLQSKDFYVPSFLVIYARKRSN